MFLPLLFVFLQYSLLVAHPSGPSPDEVLDRWFELIDPLNTYCACASGASLKDIKKLWDTSEFPDDKPCLKCYVKCLFFKLCLVDPDGSVNRDEFVKQLGIRNKVYRKCCERTNDILDPCDKFYRFLECIFSYIWDDKVDEESLE